MTDKKIDSNFNTDNNNEKKEDKMKEDKTTKEFIKQANEPIIIENDILGTLKLRPIFSNDLNYLFEKINEGIDGELLCKKFIIHQFNSPVISIESLNELENSEIIDILEKYLERNNMEKFFNLSDSTVYDDFKEGLINYREHIVDSLTNHHMEIVESVRNSLNLLNIYGGLENYVLSSQINAMQIMANNSGVAQAVQNLKDMADFTSPVEDALGNSGVSQAVQNLNDMADFTSPVEDALGNSAVSQAMSSVDSVRVIAGDKSNVSSVSQALTGVDVISQTMYNINNIFNNSAVSQVSEILNAIQPQIDFWNDWINSNEYIFKFFEDYNEFWKNVEERYNISKRRALKCVKNYHWFISPSMDPSIVYDLVSICESNSKSKWGAINHVFNNYFLSNDCKNLDLFVDNWSSNPIFEGRMKIIRDCVEIIKNCPKDVNFSNLVVPVLIAQIDGIQMEFMIQKGLTVNKNIVCDLEGNRKKDQHGQNIKFDRYIRDLTYGDEFFDVMKDVFLEVLFQHTMPGEDYKASIKFSRHKILHGENFRYGRKDYVMRCFMILDFLHGLSLEN